MSALAPAEEAPTEEEAAAAAAVAKAQARVRLKTRTLVATLAALRVIPAAGVSQSAGADVQPEAILVKNIIVEAFRSVSRLADLTGYLEYIAYNVADDIFGLDSKLSAKLSALCECLPLIKSGQAAFNRKRFASTTTSAAAASRSTTTDSSYDADDSDEEGRADAVKKRKRKSVASATISSPTDGGSDSTVDRAIYALRDVLILVQNDRGLAKSFRMAITSVAAANRKTDFLRKLKELQFSATERAMKPYGAYVQEIESLCSSIALRQKFAKTASRLKHNLSEVEEERERSLEDRLSEREALSAANAAIRTRSLQAIGNYKASEAGRMKVVAWSSHARQSKTMQHVFELRRELESATEEHVEAETNMRHENVKLETEVKNMIDRYDKEMFQRHRTIDEIRAVYDVERGELSALLDELAVVEVERQAILEENRLVALRRRDEQLKSIRRAVAAKVIQRSWRAYKTRRLLKSKKKRKKKK